MSDGPNERTQAAIDNMQAALTAGHHIVLLTDIALHIGKAQRLLPGDTPAEVSEELDQALGLITEAVEGPNPGTDT